MVEPAQPKADLLLRLVLGELAQMRPRSSRSSFEGNTTHAHINIPQTERQHCMKDLLLEKQLAAFGTCGTIENPAAAD